MLGARHIRTIVEGAVAGAVLQFDVNAWNALGASVQLGLFNGAWRSGNCGDGAWASEKHYTMSYANAAIYSLQKGGGTSVVWTWNCHREQRMVWIADAFRTIYWEECEPVWMK